MDNHSITGIENDISTLLKEKKALERQGESLALADVFFNLSLAYAEALQFENSQRCLSQAEIVCIKVDPDNALMGEILDQKARAAATQGDYPVAIQLAENSIKNGQKHLAETTEKMAARHALLGDLLSLSEIDYPRACQSYAQMLHILEHYGEAGDVLAIPYLPNYAYALLRSGDMDLAREMIDHALFITGEQPTGHPQLGAWRLDAMAVEAYYHYMTGAEEIARKKLFELLEFVQTNKAMQTPLSVVGVKWMREVMERISLVDYIPALVSASADGLESVLPVSDESNISRLVCAQFDAALEYLKRVDFANTLAAFESIQVRYDAYLKSNPAQHALILRWTGVCCLGLQDFEKAYHLAIQSVGIEDQPEDLKASGYQFAALCAQVFGKSQVSDALFDKARSSGLLSLEEALFWGETVLKLSGLAPPDL